MRPASVKSKYADNLARQKRVRFLIKIAIISAAVLAMFGAMFYFLFFYGLMDIKVITFEGLNYINSDELRGKISQKFEDRYLGYIQYKNNLYFLNTDDLRSEILSQYTILESVKIEKKMPHEIVFKFKERSAIGVWCFVDDCVYFDDQANTWGPAIKSSGFLILAVEDLRESDKKEIDLEYFEALKLFVDNKNLPLLIKGITIPKDAFRDFKAHTQTGYDLLFSLDSDISGQLEVLKIFLKDDKNANINFRQIDLRIDGRVYYMVI